MTQYANGATFERQIKKAFEESGWWVQRSAGSHGEADLVAIAANNRPVLVQCKKEETKSINDEVRTLANLADSLDCKAVWVDKYKRKARYRRIEFIRHGEKRYEWSEYRP